MYLNSLFLPPILICLTVCHTSSYKFAIGFTWSYIIFPNYSAVVVGLSVNMRAAWQLQKLRICQHPTQQIYLLSFFQKPVYLNNSILMHFSQVNPTELKMMSWKHSSLSWDTVDCLQSCSWPAEALQSFWRQCICPAHENTAQLIELQLTPICITAKFYRL